MGLRLLSYNVRYATLDDGPDAWSERRDGVADLVRSATPDVVCFQEVWETQFEDLADRLPDYTWVRERTSSGEHTPVAYRTDRLSVVDREVFSLSETPSDRHAMDWETTVPRVTTAARLRGDDAAFVAASTHLDHGSEWARRRGAALLAERFGDRPVPTVMAGDFNCTPADPPYRAMTEAGFRDARDDADASAGPETTFNDFDGPQTGRRIDHVFVAGDLDVDRLEVLSDRDDRGRYPSDHFPVLAELSPGDDGG